MAWFTAYEEAAQVRDASKVGFTRHLVVCLRCGCDEITCAELGCSCAVPAPGADIAASGGIGSRLPAGTAVGEAAAMSRIDPAAGLIEAQGVRS